MSNKNHLNLLCLLGSICLVVSTGNAAVHSLSAGLTADAFTKEDNGIRTTIGQLVYPVRYQYAAPRFNGFVSSGLSSSAPFVLQGTRVTNAKLSGADTRLGFIAPLWGNNLLWSASYLLPALYGALNRYELLTEVALSDQDFRFRQTRLRDGANWNLNVAYARSIGKHSISAGSGYFLTQEYDNSDPGDFAIFNLALTSRLDGNTTIRNDLIGTHNLPTRFMGEEVLTQGNSLTYNFDLKRKLPESRTLSLHAEATYNHYNSTNDQREPHNSNRHRTGIRAVYGTNSDRKTTYVVGLDHLLENGYSIEDGSVYRPDLTRGELGVRWTIKRPESSLAYKPSAALLVGNSGLWGVKLSTIVQLGGK